MNSKKSSKNGDFSSSSSSSSLNSSDKVNVHVQPMQQKNIEQAESSSAKISNSPTSSASPLSSSSSATSSPNNNHENAVNIHDKYTNSNTNMNTINVSANHNSILSPGSSRNSSSNISNIQSELTISTQTAHMPTTYFYPYLHPSAHSAPPSAYSAQIDFNSAANWPQAMAAAAMAMAAAVNDPISMAAYMSSYPPGEIPPNYDPMSFGFQPAAFSYGYSNTGTIDYSTGNVPSQTSAGIPAPQQPHRLSAPQVWTGAPNTSPVLAIHPNSNDSINNQTANTNVQSIHQPNTKWMPVIQDPSLLTVPPSSVSSTAHFSDLPNPHLLDIYQQQGVYRYPSTASHHVLNSHYNNHHKQFSRQHHSNITNFQQQFNYTSKSNNYKPNNYNENVAAYQQNKLENEFNTLSLYSDSNGRTNANKTRSSSNKYLNNQKYQNNFKKINSNYNGYNSNSNVNFTQENNNSNDKSENSANQNSVVYTKNSSDYATESNMMNLNEQNLNEQGQMSSSKSENGSSGGITWASIVGVQKKSQQSTNQAPALLSITTSSNSTLSSSSTTPSHSSMHQHHDSLQSFQYSQQNNFQRPHKNFKNDNNKPDYSSYKIVDDNSSTKTKYSNKNNINNNNLQEYQQHFEFSLSNGAFPSITENYKNGTYDSNSITRKSFINDENANNNNNNNANPNNKFSLKNYKKQQLYNNYQKHQQRQFGLNQFHSQNQITNYLAKSNAINAESTHGYDHIDLNSYRLQNSASNETYSTDLSNANNKNSTQSRVTKNRSFKNHLNNNNLEDENEYANYKRHHHPKQPTISSFMTDLDKSLFSDNKNKNTPGSFNNNNNNNKNSNTYADKNNYQVSIELKPQQIDPKNYNPKEFNTSPKAARFFVIKSYSEDDVYRSIKYNIWCSTEHGNRRLDSAYSKGDSSVPVYLFFSVNGSGHFCGMAEMISRVDYDRKIDLWSQDKWRGCFQVNWIYVKDVPNSLLRNIKLENNDNKPVTNSRDTQEIPFDKGKQVLKVFHTYNHSSSIFDDFDHYEKRQDEDNILKSTSNNDNQSNKFLINEGDINKKDVTLNSNINISNKNNNEFSKTLSTFSSASAHSDNEFIQDIQTDKPNDQLEQNQHHQVQFKQIILT